MSVATTPNRFKVTEPWSDATLTASITDDGDIILRTYDDDVLGPLVHLSGANRDQFIAWVASSLAVNP